MRPDVLPILMRIEMPGQVGYNIYICTNERGRHGDAAPMGEGIYGRREKAKEASGPADTGYRLGKFADRAGVRAASVPAVLGSVAAAHTGGSAVVYVPVLAARMDLSALLNACHLPDPRESGLEIGRYPDIQALLSMELQLAYGQDGNMELSLRADTDTLRRWGIELSPLEFTMEAPAYVAPREKKGSLAVEQEPAEEEKPLTEGYLTSLLDPYGRGYNLRTVCEEVQARRDQAAKSLFKDEYETEKLQLNFIVFPVGQPYRNCYRAVYAIREKTDSSAKMQKVQYLTVEVLDLAYSSREGVTFRRSSLRMPDTLREAESLSEYEEMGCTCFDLYGGGMRNEERSAFDQNGFVRFFDTATSFQMANGLYWSPTYDLLEEDDIWRLTAVKGHSLANLLRYARKEIYARHYVRFSETAEKEFLNHYTGYGWYEGHFDREDIALSETEKANLRLLREIQSLIEK